MTNKEIPNDPVDRSDAGDASQLLDRPAWPAEQEPPAGQALSDIEPILMPIDKVSGLRPLSPIAKSNQPGGVAENCVARQ
jgi:hypothetical protein